MKPGKSVLLYGPRGTGKTSLVEAVAHSTGVVVAYLFQLGVIILPILVSAVTETKFVKYTPLVLINAWPVLVSSVVLSL